MAMGMSAQIALEVCLFTGYYLTTVAVDVSHASPNTTTNVTTSTSSAAETSTITTTTITNTTTTVNTTTTITSTTTSSTISATTINTTTSSNTTSTSTTTVTTVQQLCTASDLISSNLVAACGGDGTVPLGDICEAKCSAGYLMHVRNSLGVEELHTGISINLTCQTTSASKQTKPILKLPASQGTVICKKNLCSGTFTGSSEGATISFPQETALESIATYTCNESYVALGNSELHCLPVTPNVPGSTEVAWRSASDAQLQSLCKKIECDAPSDPHGTYEKNASGFPVSWKLQCEPGWHSPSTSLYAVCLTSQTLTLPAPCEFVGGCDSSKLQVSSVGSNGTNCKSWMEEGETCSVTCSTGIPVGLFTCVLMEMAGESQCAAEGAETTSVTKMAGTFYMTVSLPLNSVITSDPFVNTIRGACAETLGIWPTDFSKFALDPKSSSSRRLLLRRRLSSTSFDISYELVVRDLTKLGQLQRSLNSLGNPVSNAFQIFSRTVLANGIQVLTLTVTREATPFQSTILMQQTFSNSAGISLTGDDEESSLNTSTIAGGFIGAMVGLTAITAILYIITARRRSKEQSER